jgi:hypothetical protein
MNISDDHMKNIFLHEINKYGTITMPFSDLIKWVNTGCSDNDDLQVVKFYCGIHRPYPNISKLSQTIQNLIDEKSLYCFWNKLTSFSQMDRLSDVQEKIIDPLQENMSDEIQLIKCVYRKTTNLSSIDKISFTTLQLFCHNDNYYYIYLQDKNQ